MNSIEQAIKNEFNMIWTYQQFDVYMPMLLNAFNKWQQSQQPEIPNIAIEDIVSIIASNLYNIHDHSGHHLMDTDKCDEVAQIIYSEIKAALNQKGNGSDAVEFYDWDYAYDIFKETEDFKVSTAKNLVYIYKIWLERNYKLYKNKQ